MSAERVQRTENILQQVREHRTSQCRMGYGENTDDQHQNGELIQAALSYANLAREQILTRDYSKLPKPGGYYVAPGGSDIGYKKPNAPVPTTWPFSPIAWGPGYPRYNLVRAATCLIAELERLERLDKKLMQVPKKKPKGWNNPHGEYWDVEPEAATPTQGYINPSNAQLGQTYTITTAIPTIQVNYGSGVQAGAQF